MALILPIYFHPRTNRFHLNISKATYDMLQTIFYSAEAFVDPVSLRAYSAHTMKDILEFREKHLSEAAKTLRFTATEFDLLNKITIRGIVHLHHMNEGNNLILSNLTEEQRALHSELEHELRTVSETLSIDFDLDGKPDNL